MKPIFLKFPSGRIFTVLLDISKSRNAERNTILFFDEKTLTKYFEVSPQAITKKFMAFFASPTKIGMSNITKKGGFFYVCLCATEALKKFFEENVFPVIKSENNNIDYLILSEELSGKKEVFEITGDFCPTFNIYCMNQLIPVSYSPFSYYGIEIDQKDQKKQYLSLGYEKDFTISYLEDNQITISPNFGELDNLYEIDAMDIMVNSIIGHGKFKNITILKDYNNYSMISDYTRRFPVVNSVNHIFSHMANVLYDNDLLKEKSIGIVYDSISYDDSDQIRGSEVLYGSLGSLEIAGGWKPLPLPGGDIANIEPWRIALAVLKEVTKTDLESIKLPLIKHIKDNPNYSYIFDAINQGNISYSLSSSMHHIIAALGEIIFYEEATYDFEYFENMMDQSIVEKLTGKAYDIPIIEEDGKYLVDTYQLFKVVISEILAKVEAQQLISNVILSISQATAQLIEKISKKHKEKKVVLAGEYFKHPHFLTIIYQELDKKGFKLFMPRNIPIDDSGISVGQLLFYYYSNQ